MEGMKNRSAADLAKLAVRARKRKYTPKQISDLARKAVNSRKDRQKPEPEPVRWWGLFDFDDPQHPQLVAYSQDKRELRAHPNPEGTVRLIEVLDYDPTKFVLKAEFESEESSLGDQVEALRTVFEGRKKGSRK